MTFAPSPSIVQTPYGSGGHGGHIMQQGSMATNGISPRGPDYVVFERKPAIMFSRTSIEKAQAAKLKLEHFYKKVVDDCVERNQR